MNGLGRIAIAGTIGIASLSNPIQSASAQTCVPLQVVGENTTVVEKAVSPPGTGVTRDNWNTDFVVPSTQAFRRYVASVYPINGGEYTIQMNLKYNDETADTVYNQVTGLAEGRAVAITGAPRANANPYQINLQIGGVPVLGNAYRVSVSACN